MTPEQTGKRLATLVGNIWLPRNAAARVSPHFTAGELHCKCGRCAGFINAQALRRLEQVRERIGQPFVLTSAYRCPAHNQAVGGAGASLHMLGCAFDVSWQGWPAELREWFVAEARAAFGGGIGLYANWCHVDTGEARSWGSWSHVKGR